MQLFKRKPKLPSRVGLVLNPDYLALVHMVTKEGEPHVLHCEHRALQSSKEAGRVLEKLVQKLDLEGKEVSYVLNPRDYQLHLVEAPKVEPEELRSAVRWKIKDLLDMKIDDAAIDVFPVPADAYRGREMVYVVAALKSRIQTIVEIIDAADLQLAVIDIPELVMKNIAARFLPDENGVAFMDLRRSGSTINISRGGELYLTRRINTQLDHEVMRSPNWDSLRDRLVLEIERSLDYYESQMGQGSIDKIVIAPRQQDTGALVEALNSQLQPQVSSLDLAKHLHSAVTLTPTLQQLVLPAVGATLRGARKPGAQGMAEGRTRRAQEAA